MRCGTVSLGLIGALQIGWALPVGAKPDSVADPQFAPALLAFLDRPLATSRLSVSPHYPGGPLGSVRCFRFAAGFVKELDFGEHGNERISIRPPMRGHGTAACNSVTEAGEIALPSGPRSYFVGAKGRFALTQSTEGKDRDPFAIYDLTSGEMTFAGNFALDTLPTRLEVLGDVLFLDYTEASEESCLAQTVNSQSSLDRGTVAERSGFVLYTRVVMLRPNHAAQILSESRAGCQPNS